MKDKFKLFIERYNLNELRVLDLIWFSLLALLNINYFIAGSIAKNGRNLSLALDKEIPFLSMFIFPYIYWYVYIFLGIIFILLKDRRKYIRVLFSISIGMCVCYLFYYLFPVEIVRPAIINNSIPNRLVNIIYEIDKPLNCFPSIHVLNTYLIMRYTTRKDNKSWYYYTQVIGILIIFSTLFIKQHFILDGIAAIFVAEVAMLLVRKIEDKHLDRILALPYKLVDRIKKKNNISVN